MAGVVSVYGRFEFQDVTQGAKQVPTAFDKKVKTILQKFQNAQNYINIIIIMSDNIEQAKSEFV